MRVNIFGYRIEISKQLEGVEMPDELKEAIEVIKKYGVKVGSSDKQKKAASNATETRTKNAKKKIENAINLLRLEGKEITQYAVSKYSGCSVNTVRKYLKDIK